MAVSTKKRKTYTGGNTADKKDKDEEKRPHFLDPVTEKAVLFAGDRGKSTFNPLKLFCRIAFKSKILKIITIIAAVIAVIFLVLVIGTTIEDINMALNRPLLSEEQVEDIRAKIEYLNRVTGSKTVSYANDAARECDWTYVISAVLAKNNNNLDNLYTPETGINVVTTYTGGYIDTIRRYYNQYNLGATEISEYDIYGLIYVESGWDPNASSGVAFGLCQFRVETIEEQLGPGADPFDPVQSIHACCKYLSYLYSETGDLRGALTSYNCGLGNYMNGQWAIFGESAQYANKVIAAADEYRNGTLSIPNATILGVAYMDGNYLGESFDAFFIGSQLQDIDTACEKLEMTDDEKELAKVLVANNEYYKYYFGDEYDFSFKFLNSTYSGASGTVNGIPVYYQYDARWADNYYSGETIQAAGCCPTSTAMVVSWLGSKGIDIHSIDINNNGETTPDEMAAHFTMIGANADYSGSYGWGITRTCLSLNVSVTETSDINSACNALASGKPVILNLKRGIVPAGHFAVAVGIEDGMIMINDPGYARNDYTLSGALFDRDTIDYSTDTFYIIEAS